MSMYHLKVHYYNLNNKKKTDLWFRYCNEPFELALIDKCINNTIYKNVYLYYFDCKLLRFHVSVSHDGPYSTRYNLIVYYLDKNSMYRKDLWQRISWKDGFDIEKFTLEKLNID